MEYWRKSLLDVYPLVLAFCTGMAVMGVEISSERLLAPFFGISILVWTVIIGSIMIALTAGYYLGGLVSERYPELHLLGLLLFGASTFVIFLPHFWRPVTQAALESICSFDMIKSVFGEGRGTGSLVLMMGSCLLIISCPAVIFGMTPPFLIRMEAIRTEKIGYSAGKVYALSSLGSIIGTFLPALVLIPFRGTRSSFLFFGGVLLLASLPSIRRGRRVFVILALVILASGYLLAMKKQSIKNLPHLVQERETIYNFVQIFQEEQSRGRVETWLRLNEGFGIQSVWVKGERFSLTYHDAATVIPTVYKLLNPADSPMRILVIGLAGGVFSYKTSLLYPDVIVDGVEIDAGLIEAAKNYFPLGNGRHLNIHIADGREFLRRTSARYNIIFVDVYRAPYIPFHLATLEFYESLKERLTPDGILALNVMSLEKGFPPFKGISNTLAAIYPYVYFYEFRVSPTHRMSNYIVMASMNDLHLETPSVENLILESHDENWRDIIIRMRKNRDIDLFPESFFKRIHFDQKAEIFLDDRSPIDMMVQAALIKMMLEEKF